MRLIDSRRTTFFLIALIFLLVFYDSIHRKKSIPLVNNIVFKKFVYGSREDQTYTKNDIDDILYRRFKQIEDRVENKTKSKNMWQVLRRSPLPPSMNATATRNASNITTSSNKHNKIIAKRNKDNARTIQKARGSSTTLCLTGKPYGYLSEKHPGWSNFVLAVHHARRIAANAHGVVVIHSPHSKRFQALWDGSEDVMFVKKWKTCHQKWTYKQVFYHFPFTSYTYFQMYKSTLYNKAVKAMEIYRKKANGKQIVSVHRRWFIENGKTQCEQRMKNCPQFCTMCGDLKFNNDNKGTYKYACHYTEENVRAKFKDEINDDAMIILFTDGQSESYDSKFTNRDRHQFQVQQVMMSLTDVHIGNPASSVDKVVGTWRWDMNKTTLPKDCYRYDHKHNKV